MRAPITHTLAGGPGERHASGAIAWRRLVGVRGATGLRLALIYRGAVVAVVNTPAPASTPAGEVTP